MITRIRIIHADKRISVRDLAFSQICELLKDISRDEREAFWAKTETALPSGDSIFLVREGV
jgi:hypothetical protein